MSSSSSKLAMAAAVLMASTALSAPAQRESIQSRTDSWSGWGSEKHHRNGRGSPAKSKRRIKNREAHKARMRNR